MGEVACGGVGKYLLTGLLKCGECGAGLEVRSRPEGGLRIFFYGCSAYYHKGKSVCANRLTIPLRNLHEATIGALRDELLAPGVLAEAVERAAAALRSDKRSTGDVREALKQQILVVERAIRNLVEAIAKSGGSNSLLTALEGKEREKEGLLGQLASTPEVREAPDPDRAAKELAVIAAEWQATLTNNPAEARELGTRGSRAVDRAPTPRGTALSNHRLGRPGILGCSGIVTKPTLGVGTPSHFGPFRLHR